MGLYLLDRKLAAQALPYLQTARKLNPQNAQYLVNIGTAFMHLMTGSDEFSSESMTQLQELLLEAETFGLRVHYLLTR